MKITGEKLARVYTYEKKPLRFYFIGKGGCGGATYIEILVFARKAIVVVPLFTIDHELKLRELFRRW